MLVVQQTSTPATFSELFFKWQNPCPPFFCLCTWIWLHYLHSWTWSLHVTETPLQLMACRCVFFPAAAGLGVGTHTHLPKHVVEWCDAEGTICCLAIKRHPHRDRAAANVKEIKARAKHRQEWWSTPCDPRCISKQPTRSGFIYYILLATRLQCSTAGPATQTSSSVIVSLTISTQHRAAVLAGRGLTIDKRQCTSGSTVALDSEKVRVAVRCTR